MAVRVGIKNNTKSSFWVDEGMIRGYFYGTNQYSPLSGYWSFRGLYGLCDVNQGVFKPIVEELWSEYEKQSIAECEPLKKTLKNMYAGNPTAAINFAKRYSTGVAWQSVGQANTMRNAIMTKIASE